MVYGTNLGFVILHVSRLWYTIYISVLANDIILGLNLGFDAVIPIPRFISYTKI
jgi:hypothetical protein